MATVTPSALARVPQHSPASANARITERAIKSVKEAAKMSEEELTTRIGGLQREWDIERILEFNTGCFTLLGLLLAHWVHPNWLALAIAVPFFLVHHAVLGAAALPGLEIQDEAAALRALRGDYAEMCQHAGVKQGLLDHMLKNKQYQGRFIGTAVAKAARAAEE
ncbi:hypothetical protein CHLNCDRAFT_143433 [Chlorella variabilis]|uniref:Uncharacterized protein n=1 Tax=Chlorella variabilis TaxID=554065 RepID=E1ZAW5_CHLVA|nr:hypothetical protein CHLNCDRAFT_143433 [Chlorella variabilis]EFN56918.1 hypothetical protein CHLNCDRAFT_143433 [Chlorella variabilis]|eukprot:XP_005849020.1 hypothetical protein CHLNCDRAFT_143433 [Chlorella variabilis]